jgi:uncharacterized protein (TIGR02466 family)
MQREQTTPEPRSQVEQNWLSTEIRKTLVPIFTTPIVNFRWPNTDELNQALREAILQHEARSAGISRSNVGGWHSQTDLFTWELDSIKALRGRIHTFVTELCRTVARDPQDPMHRNFRLEGWANVMRHAQYHSLHSHPNAFWSGVYYVSGNPKPAQAHPFSGKLELVDPRPGASLSFSEHTSLYGRFLLNPLAGQMVIFPGWLQHQVHPYFGPGERITIAFNVTLNPGKQAQG